MYYVIALLMYLVSLWLLPIEGKLQTLIQKIVRMHHNRLSVHQYHTIGWRLVATWNLSLIHI